MYKIFYIVLGSDLEDLVFQHCLKKYPDLSLPSSFETLLKISSSQSNPKAKVVPSIGFLCVVKPLATV